MNKKKKIIAISSIAAAVALASVGVGVTLAYLADHQSKDNTITIGHETAKISEVWSEPEKQTMRNYFDKEVEVRNEGSVPCFVRVYAEFSDSTVGDKASVSYTGYPYYKWADFKDGLADEAHPITEDWVFIPYSSTDDAKLRGYFYYTKKVPSGGKTSKLFTDIKVDYTGGDYSVSNIDTIRDFEMIVYSETVQTTETGYLEKNGESIYGYDYAASEWLDAWKSFLKIT